jgi:outer membrane usher protein
VRPLISRARFTANLAFVLVTMVAWAPARADDVELVIPLTINEVPQGETAVIIAGPDMYVPVHILERSGVSGEPWRRALLVAGLNAPERTIQGERAVSLLGLEPAVRFVFDEANLTLAVTIDPKLIAQQSVTLGSAKPPDIAYSSDSSAFANYALSGQRSNVSGFGELGASVRRSLLYTSFSKTPQAGFVRGLTNLSHDDSRNLRRWVVGDEAVFSDELGGSGFVGGITIERNFGIDPYFVRYPALNVRGIATTPSQVDIYVNGVLVSRQEVAPGPFEIANVPAVGGTSTAQIVVRDAFGREQSQTSSFYYSTSVLGRGISDYIYSAGALRDNLEPSNFKYGTPIAVGSQRYGLTDRLTVGGRLEATRDVISGGPSLAFASSLGEFDVKLAASSAKASRSGTAAQFSFRKLSRRTNVSMVMRTFSREYANFSMDPSRDRPLSQWVVNASVLPKWGNLGVQWSVSRMRDSVDQNRLSLISSLPLMRAADLMITASSIRDGAGPRRAEYSVGVSVHAATNTTINAAALSSGGTRTITGTIQKSVSVGEGLGYRLQAASTAGQTDGVADVEYQSRFGRYELDTPLRNSELTANVSGGLVYEGGRLMATRAVAQSFAVVRVPGIAGVRVYLSNQLIGRTDARGDLLMPDMLSYYGNRIRIDDRDIPMNYDVQVIEKTIAPPNRGGALVEFIVKRVRTVTGAISINSAADTKSAGYGQITITRLSGDVVSPLGAAGEFYFENLSTGTYRALVEYEKGSCSFSLVIPDSNETTINVGRVVCTGAKP